MRQTEKAKHAWLDACYRRLMPPELYALAHQKFTLPEAQEDAMARVHAWIAVEGYEVKDNWTLEGLGAVLIRQGKVVSEWRAELVTDAFLPSKGNYPVVSPMPPGVEESGG